MLRLLRQRALATVGLALGALALLAHVFAPKTAHALMLDGTNEILELVTSTASAVDVTAWYVDYTTSASTPGSQETAITTATTTTVVSSPSASTQREIRHLNIANKGTEANTITVNKDVGGTNYQLFSVTLPPGGVLQYTEEGEWKVYDSSGRHRIAYEQPGYTGLTFPWSKVATAIDAAGYHYLTNKDSGFPGAWNVGTPGVNGVTTNCSVVGTAGSGGALSTGSPVLPNPTSGGWYLTKFGLNGVAVNTYQLIDIVWYNTGLVVTTTTAQSITTPTFPARDLNGSSNGEGYLVALYALTALGNTAAISNTTVSYTNSDGVSGRTATFSAAAGFNAPATPVIGTFMPFQLQAGDRGIQSIQSITLGTTYTSGTMMLIVYRPISLEGVAQANGPSGGLSSRNAYGLNPGIRIWNGTCFGVAVLGAPATTAPSTSGGIIELMER